MGIVHFRPARFWVVAICSLAFAFGVFAEETTLVRLSFWVPFERLQAFERAYETQVMPLLVKHRLRASAQKGGVADDRIFSRLFEVENPLQGWKNWGAVARDEEWTKVLKTLAAEFETVALDSLLPHHFELYSTSAGTGRVRKAGVGQRQGLWHSFSVHDGLDVTSVVSIQQDAQGDIWFAGSYQGLGVSRYDGERFWYLTAADGLVSNVVNTILVDSKQHIWFGTGGGISRYDGQRFETLSIAGGLVGNWVNSLYEDRQGGIWVGTNKGISRYDGQVFESFQDKEGRPSSGVNALCEDRQGLMWIGTEEGISRYDGQRFETLSTADGLVDNWVTVLYEDRQGLMWIGTRQGLCHYDGDQFHCAGEVEALLPAHEPVKGILSLAEDSQGNLWIGTIYGVVRYDGQHAVAFTQKDGLAGNEVRALYKDRQGLMWVGSLSGGVTRYDGVQFTHFTLKDGLPSPYVFSALKDQQNRLWFGARGGVVRYSQGTFVPLSGSGFRVTAILEDSRGQLWFKRSAAEGVQRFDGTHLVSFTEADGLGGKFVRAMLEDRQGQLWFSTADGEGGGGGISRYDGTRFTTFTEADGLANNVVSAIGQDRQGQLWFGHSQGALTRYDGTRFTTFTEIDGLTNNFVSAIGQDHQGQLWFGHSRGFTYYDGNSFKTFNRVAGSPLGNVGNIYTDRDGLLWFSVFGIGVVRFDGLVFQVLSRRDGLLDNGVHAVVQDGEGALWITTDGGITRYRPLKTPPSIRLKEVIADHTYEPVEKVAFPSSQGFVRFAFQGSSITTPPEQMVYVYRLQGYDNQWRQTREDRVQYTDLTEGQYAFEVKAVDRDFNYSEAPATIRVVVHRPYGRLALLSSLGLALVIAIGALGYGRRRSQERDQVRSLMAREQRQRIEAQQQALPATAPTGLNWTLDDFVEQSSPIQSCLNQVRALQQQPDARALIVGEPGTGKELIARALHAGSKRGQAPFVALRCATLPQDLQTLDTRTHVQSQLFGHAQGAFAGADDERQGLVQQADGGTLFFDEVGLLPLPLQDHLMRVLRQGQVRRLGEDTARLVDVRVLAATQMDLELQGQLGLFRQEFYQFIAPIKLEVPPLRQRTEDIGLLARQVVLELAQKTGKDEIELSAAAVARLETYNFPGNVRQLRSILERALLASGGKVIGPEHLQREA